MQYLVSKYGSDNKLEAPSKDEKALVDGQLLAQLHHPTETGKNNLCPTQAMWLQWTWKASLSQILVATNCIMKP